MKKIFINNNLSQETTTYLTTLIKRFSHMPGLVDKSGKKEINDVFNLLFKSLDGEKKYALMLNLLGAYNPKLGNTVIEEELSKMRVVMSTFGTLTQRKEVGVSLLYKLYELKNDELFEHIRQKIPFNIKDSYVVPHVISSTMRGHNHREYVLQDVKTNILDLALRRVINHNDTDEQYENKKNVSDIINPLKIEDLKKVGLSEKFDLSLSSSIRSCRGVGALNEISLLKFKNLDSFIELSGAEPKTELGLYAIDVLLKNKIETKSFLHQSYLNFFEEKYVPLLTPTQKEQVVQSSVSSFCETQFFRKIAQKLSAEDSSSDGWGEAVIHNVMNFVKQEKEELKPNIIQILGDKYLPSNVIEAVLDRYIQDKIEQSNAKGINNGTKLAKLTSHQAGYQNGEKSDIIFEKISLLLQLNALGIEETMQNRKKQKL